MAKEKAAASAGDAPAPPAGPAESKIPLLMVLVNTLVAFGAIGALYYFRVLYKRPEITETHERERIEKSFQKKTSNSAYPTVPFDPITINIESGPSRFVAPQREAAQPGDTQTAVKNANGKLHYATIAFSLEILDAERKGEIDRLKGRIVDKVISILGRKSFNELVTVQGRYLLRTQLIDSINDMIYDAGKSVRSSYDEDPLITNVYFSQFIVQ